MWSATRMERKEMKLVATRNITPNECHWLLKTIVKGSEVFEYRGYTYGCVSPSGIAVTIHDGKDPFFELPTNALIPICEEIPFAPWLHIDGSLLDFALQYFATCTEGVLQDSACSDCKGRGYTPIYSEESCVRCDGTGKLRHMTHHLDDWHEQEEIDSFPDDVKGHYSEPGNQFDND